MTLAAEVLVRDENGNTLYRAEMPEVPYDRIAVKEAHISDADTLIVTVRVSADRVKVKGA